MTDEGLSPIPREARPYQGHHAGLVSRTIANLIDAAVVGAILVAGYVAVNGVLFVGDPRGFAFIELSLLAIVSAALVVTTVYFAFSWAITGRTYGCHVMGLRVVTRQAGRVSPAVALARAVLCVCFPVGLLWCAVSSGERSIQDVLLRTSVIYDWRPRAPDR